MSKSGAVAATRATSVVPPARRMVTDPLLPTTCTLVSSVSASTKKPLPVPALVSTRTTAGITRPMTSSSDTGAVSSAERTGDASEGRLTGAAVSAGAEPGSATAGAASAGPASRDVVGVARVWRGDDRGAGFMYQTVPAMAINATTITVAGRTPGAMPDGSAPTASPVLKPLSRTYPQRHSFTLLGIRRSHAGHTQPALDVRLFCIGGNVAVSIYLSVRRRRKYSRRKGAQNGWCFS